MGRRLRAVWRRAAISAARPSICAPSAAAMSGSSPAARAAPTSPLRMSPLPPVASPGLPATMVEVRPSRRGDHGGNALEQDRGPGLPGRTPRRAAQGSSSRVAASVGKQGAEFARVWSEHQGAGRRQCAGARRSARRRPPGHRRRAPRPERPRASEATNSRRPGSPAETGADDHRVCTLDQIQQSSRRRLIERMREGLNIRLRLDQRRDCFGRGCDMHQPGAGPECRPRRHPDGAGHPGVPADDDNAAPVSLVVPGLEPRQPLGGLDVGDYGRPGWIWRRVSDVDHDEIAYLVPREQVASAESPEGDRQIRPGRRRGPCRSGDRLRLARRSAMTGTSRSSSRARRVAMAGRGVPVAPVPSNASTARATLGHGPSGATSRTPSARATLGHPLPQLGSRCRWT